MNLRRILVGRERELELLEALLERARAGQGGVGLISGPAGAGKTRLLEELAERAVARGFVVARGQGWELGNPPSYWPWVEMFRCLFAEPQGREGAQALAALLPEIDGQAPPRSGEPNADVLQLYDSADRYLGEAASRRPVLLVIDDVHAADLSSLRLCELVARQLRSRRLALLCSHRPGELRRRPELQRSLARLSRDAERCELGGLAERDVLTLLHVVSGQADATAARELHAISEGNPLFLHELLRLPGAGWVARRGDLPEGIRSLLRERFEVVETRHLRALQAAAIVGREFSLWLAAEVAEEPLAAVEVAVREASAADLVVPGSLDEWRFTHALMAETLVSELASAEREAQHRRAAEALERHHGTSLAAPWNEIAHHWLAAGRGAAPRALDAAVRAATRAPARLAFADAARFYQRALEALDVAAPANGARRGELLVAVVEAQARAGERTAAEEACGQAVAFARLLADGALLARAALALGTEAVVGAADGPLIRYLEEALLSLPAADGALRALVTARLASARQPEADPAGPMQLARSAIAMAQRTGDPEVMLHTLHSALGALMDFAPAEERLPLNGEALRLARSLGDRPRALLASQRLAFDRVELGDVAGFERALREHAAVAGELDQPRHRWVVPMFRSMRANWEGRFADADRLEEEARARRDQGAGEGAGLVTARPLFTALLRRDSALLERTVSGILSRQRDDRALAGVFAALLASVKGERDAAAKELAALAAQGVEPFAAPAQASGGAPEERPGAVSGYLLLPELTSEIAWAVRAPGLARRLYDELLPQAGKPFVATGIAFSLHGVVDHALMRLAAIVESPARVDEHAESALALCTRLGAAPISALVRFDWAQSLRERAGSAHLARARELASSAAVVAAELGMRQLARASQELVAQHRADPHEPSGPVTPPAVPPAVPPDVPAAVPIQLQRDGDVWRLSAGSHTVLVRDSRGMHMLARLVDSAGREVHVLELSGSPGGVDAGDAGELLDRQAQGAYAERLRALDVELEEASSYNDLGRQERLLGEAEVLRQELARAFGKGGRERRAPSATERARINVRRRLTVALDHIEHISPALAQILRGRVKTGIYCIYRLEG